MKMNLQNSFADIVENDKNLIQEILPDSEKYYAHLKGDKKETLSAHTKLVSDYFLSLVNEHKLEEIIDSLIAGISKKSSGKMNLIIKKLFFRSLLFHDLGKINPNFQYDKMKNSSFKRKRFVQLGSKHSEPGAFLYNWFHINQLAELGLTDEEINKCNVLVILFSYSIKKHHGSLVTISTREDFSKEVKEFTGSIKLNAQFDSEEILKALKENQLADVFDSIASFELFLLLKINSSLLTAADYYATNEFMTSIDYHQFGVMDSDLKERIIKGVRNIEYNKKLFLPDADFTGETFPDVRNKNNLNILRTKIAFEVLHNYNKESDKNLFYIEAPTGSGKTNISMLLVASILEKRDEIDKIFYVFPFTTLITQTLKTIRETINIEEKEIAELHSKASPKEESEEEYGSKWRNYINNLFVNYPFTITSHIKFFDMLLSNKKEAVYALHRLANSVVIIDEIQSYTPSQWDKINYTLKQFAEKLNIIFVIMSATLPKIGKLLTEEESTDNFIYLVKNKKEYFTNPNFSQRVKIDCSYLEKEYSDETLKEEIYKQCENYFSNNNKVKCIAEFITKKRAQKFYELIKEDENFSDYEIYILSGLILEPRRKEIINILKKESNNKILLITTQVVEAGVDIDMDIGFKDTSIADADEQLAGRINRNAGKENSILYLFNSGDNKKTYKTDYRFLADIKPEQYMEILAGKDFDLYYDKVFERIEKKNNDLFMAENLPDFIDSINHLRYRKAYEMFELIKDNTLSVFVPLQLKKEIFNENEIAVLKKFNLLKKNKISGEELWKFYTGLITNKTGFEDTLDIKLLAPLLSKFTFNIWNKEEEVKRLLHYSCYGDICFGYIYLSDYKDVYSVEDGLKSDLEKDLSFIGF